MKNQILVAGSINMDLVLEAAELPKKGETVIGKTVRYIPGGKGANQAVAASRLGANVCILGKIGHDHFGKELKSFLKKEKLIIIGVTDSPLPSGLAVITVDQDGDNSIVYLPGANSELSSKYINQQKAVIENSRLILSTYETPSNSIDTLFSLAKKMKKTTVLNPAPAVKKQTEIFKKADYLIVNETELATYAGLSKIPEEDDNIVKAGRKLQSLGPNVVVVTLGAMGALTLENNNTIRTAGIKVKAVDTTAAGDCFVGALVTQINNGVDLNVSLDFANRAAAISVQRWGASSSLPSLDEIED